MSTVLIPHLGPSVPTYLADCVEQLRLWNKDTLVLVILDPCHRGGAFWKDLQGVTYIYTDTLHPTLAHQVFSTSYRCDADFRHGYWRYVVERFFYVEEAMQEYDITDACVIEYDVLIYTNFTELTKKLKNSWRTCRVVMDNSTRCYPSFIYVPTAAALGKINTFIQMNILERLTDMELLGKFAKDYPSELHFLPVLTEERNRSISPRSSLMGHTETNPWYLSEDASTLGVLFDSLVVGQALGGIDPRNNRGNKSGPYRNETALYSFHEMTFEWRKMGDLWAPYLDGVPLAMIHVHCKSLQSFRSDRVDMPKDDFVAQKVLSHLVEN